jgi:predicted DNA-binding transcriptional regulator AlpA
VRAQIKHLNSQLLARQATFGNTRASSHHETRGADVFDRLTGCERLLTAKELGAILAVSPKTLYSYVSRGMIPYFKIESCVRFRGVEIAEWLRKRAA